MKLTIGMPSYNNYKEVWFTVQALRMYQDLEDTEILVIDNFGSDLVYKFCSNWANAKYIRYTDPQGSAVAKNQVFSSALGEWVICIDSHVLLGQGVISKFKEWASSHSECKDLLHGPLLYDDLIAKADAFNDEWRGQMWGTWRGMDNAVTDNHEPYEIKMMGMGLFACRKDAWLGFNPAFRGFGGEEGYIHEKFRKVGQKVLCLPWLKWNHHFRDGSGNGTAPFTPQLKDKICNYLIGLSELGLDLKPIYDHFGHDLVKGYESVIMGGSANE